MEYYIQRLAKLRFDLEWPSEVKRWPLILWLVFIKKEEGILQVLLNTYKKSCGSQTALLDSHCVTWKVVN